MSAKFEKGGESIVPNEDLFNDIGNHWASVVLEVDKVLYQKGDLSALVPRLYFLDYFKESGNFNDDDIEIIKNFVPLERRDRYDTIVDAYNTALLDIKENKRIITLAEYCNQAMNILGLKQPFNLEELLVEVAETQ